MGAARAPSRTSNRGELPRRAGASASRTAIVAVPDAALVRAAMAAIVNDLDRDEWVRLGLALKTCCGDAACAGRRRRLTSCSMISRGGTTPTTRGTQARRWQSFRPAGAVGVRHAGLMARRCGWDLRLAERRFSARIAGREAACQAACLGQCRPHRTPSRMPLMPKRTRFKPTMDEACRHPTEPDNDTRGIDGIAKAIAATAAIRQWQVECRATIISSFTCVPPRGRNGAGAAGYDRTARSASPRRRSPRRGASSSFVDVLRPASWATGPTAACARSAIERQRGSHQWPPHEAPPGSNDRGAAQSTARSVTAPGTIEGRTAQACHGGAYRIGCATSR